MSHDHASQPCACGGSCSCQDSQETEEQEYLTREEYIAKLETYRESLVAEIALVDAEIQRVKIPA